MTYPDPGPTTIELSGKTTLLMVALAQELGLESPSDVVGQALGVMQTILRAKSQRHRVILRDPETGREIDLAL